MLNRAVRTFSEMIVIVIRIATDMKIPVIAVIILLVALGLRPKMETLFFPMRIPSTSPRYARIPLTTISRRISLQFISDHI